MAKRNAAHPVEAVRNPHARMIAALRERRERMVNHKAAVEKRMGSGKTMTDAARKAVTKQYDDFITMYDSKIAEMENA